eukprot:CAMPEP_0185561398 /NCGR_PEP_ID=MMETSP1381-20130426/59079_1 /TAXON_ID=298111 /ORGANISM="Pavlova sp., Strain CCMP459" /LENGTH=46 /DNA_ID= /DNA_START= /DNA_END= /DNA_ORIENTATION=
MSKNLSLGPLLCQACVAKSKTPARVHAWSSRASIDASSCLSRALAE